MKIYYYDIRTTNSFNYVRFELYYHVNHDTTFDKQLKKTGLYLMCYHHEYDNFNNKEIKNYLFTENLNIEKYNEKSRNKFIKLLKDKINEKYKPMLYNKYNIKLNK